MAALRDIARDFAPEIRDGIGWTIVYRTGRSWNALTIWSDIWNGEWETDDLNDAIGILKADPDAVIVNGYYCGHFGEDMTIDEIAAGIRWHYEGGRNRLADYCEVTQGRDALEEGRKAAEAAGLPFCERLADGGDDELSPYVYDGSMALADREKMQQAREAFEKLADALRETAAKLAEAMKPVINAVLSAFKKLWKVSAKAKGIGQGHRSAAEVAAPRSSRKESQNPEEVPQPHPALCFRGSGCGRRWRPMTAKCVGCGLDWNVSIYQKIPRTGYICPHCESRLRAGETLPNIQASQKARPQRRKGATP